MDSIGYVGDNIYITGDKRLTENQEAFLLDLVKLCFKHKINLYGDEDGAYLRDRQQQEFLRGIHIHDHSCNGDYVLMSTIGESLEYQYDVYYGYKEERNKRNFTPEDSAELDKLDEKMKLAYNNSKWDEIREIEIEIAKVVDGALRSGDKNGF